MKKLLFIIFVFYSGYIICQNNPDEFSFSSAPSKYIDVTDDNMFTYVLNDKGILLLEKGFFDLLTLRDEYEYGFTLQAIISVTENKLIVHDRDTLFLFTIVPPGMIQFQYKQKSPLTIQEIRGFGERFIIRSNNLLNFVSVDSDSVRVILETEIPWSVTRFAAVYPNIMFNSNNYIRMYRYFSSYNQIYLYYILTDKATRVAASEDYLLYFYYESQGPAFPPICYIRKRKVEYPGFQLLNNWGCSDIMVNLDGFRASKEYVYFDKALRRISNYQILYRDNNPLRKLIFTDKRAYLLGNLFEYSRNIINDSLVFHAFNYPVSIVSNDLSINDMFIVHQNSPNPFNNRTKIKYTIPGFSAGDISDAGGMASIKIYDLLGNEIRTLVYLYKSPGTYEIDFDAGGLSSGIYFYRLIFRGSNKVFYSATKKMVIMK